MTNAINKKQYKRKLSPPERIFTRSPFSIVTMVARIKGDVTSEMLKEAVTKVQQRHILLQTRIIDDDKNDQWFTSEGVQEIPIETIPRQTKDDWIKIHMDASKIPFDFSVRPAIRFILVRSPEVSELIILCHHIICDGLSLAYLVRDLMEHLGNLTLEIKPLPAPEPITLDNLPENISQSGLVKFAINKMNQKWEQKRVSFDNQDYDAISQAYWDNYDHKIFCIELSKEETSALVSLCKKEHVSITSAFAAAFSGAGSFIQGEPDFNVKTMVAVSLRGPLPNPPGEGMGYYAGGVELKFKYSLKQSFWDNARAFHKKIKPRFTDQKMFGALLNWLYLDPTVFEALNFKQLGRIVPSDSSRYEKLSAFSQQEDIASRLLKRDKIDSLETKRLGPAITNLGRMDFPESYGNLELDRLIMQPGGAFPLSQVNLVLGAVTCSGKLSLVIEYAEQAVETAAMEKIKDKAIEFLLHS